MELLIEDGNGRKHKNKLNELVSKTNFSIAIATAYLTDSQLLSSIKNNQVNVRILTSIRGNDILSGATSLNALSALLGQKVNIRFLPTSPKFHSKVYIFDDQQAIITSANLTHSALNRNVEVGVTCGSRQTKELLNWFEESWRQAKPLTENIIETLRDFEKQHERSSKRRRNNELELEQQLNDELGFDLTDSIFVKNLENKKNYFFCNSDRRNGNRTDSGGYYHEELMLSKGYALAWETYNYISHIKKVAAGDIIFLYANRRGVIAIGEATGTAESIVSSEKKLSKTALTTEWRVPVKWFTPRDNHLSVSILDHNIRATFLDISEEKYKNMREHVFNYFNLVSAP
ncbi:phospholipase D-like domain-containing protein [Pseudoalteromonas sp. Ld20]|uniref:phospholipase D-like domain-containing protein n=1 Tax=Pseudoalteromonas sp. Ld20 TaxID=649165 RepID=UPI00386F72F4